MKKSSIKIIALCLSILIGTSLFFVACNNEDESTATPLKSEEQISIFNKDNPYDVYGEQLLDLFKQVADIISNDEKLTEEEYYSKAEDLIKNANLPYPVFSEDDVIKMDTTYLSYILNKFVSQLKNKGVVIASKIIEKEIIDEIKDMEIQRRYLCVISQLKYSLYASITIAYAPTQGERFDNCMYNKMYDIDNGNIIEKIIFTAGIPESAILLVISCEYDAIFRPDIPECQYKKPFPEDIK